MCLDNGLHALTLTHTSITTYTCRLTNHYNDNYMLPITILPDNIKIVEAAQIEFILKVLTAILLQYILNIMSKMLSVLVTLFNGNFLPLNSPLYHV